MSDLVGITPNNLSRIFDCVADAVYTVDCEMRVTYLNRAAEELLGVRREAVVGRPCAQLLNSPICQAGCPVRAALAEGTPQTNWTFDILRENQRKLPVSASAARLVDRAGRMIGGVHWLRSLAPEPQPAPPQNHQYSFCGIASCSPKMRLLFDILPDIAATEATVLIQGESGTGKELFARAIHQLSPRREGPLVVVNCGALPEPLLEAEIFGARRGAYTGATEDRPGRLEMAEGGTLLLDEIGDLPLPLQVKLLRVLENHEYQPLGADRPRRADVRFLAATHRSIADMVSAGSFRRDLFFRINVVSLPLPPLRERPEDIPLLGSLFLERFNRQFGKAIRGVTPAACRKIQQYSFPGNVREHLHLIEQCVILCRDEEIDLGHLPEHICQAKSPPHGHSHGHPRLDAASLQAVLARHGNNRNEAARELGIDRTTLWRWMKQLQLLPD